jgi:transposase
MPKHYSRDLRERSVQAVTSGMTRAEVAQVLGVSISSIGRWKRTAAAGESLEPKRHPGPRAKIGPADAAALQAQVEEHPDATLAEHCARWATQHEAVSVATMSRTLARLQITLKKRQSLPVSKTR